MTRFAPRWVLPDHGAHPGHHLGDAFAGQPRQSFVAVAMATPHSRVIALADGARCPGRISPDQPTSASLVTYRVHN